MEKQRQWIENCGETVHRQAITGWAIEIGGCCYHL